MAHKPIIQPVPQGLILYSAQSLLLVVDLVGLMNQMSMVVMVVLAVAQVSPQMVPLDWAIHLQ
jgi:hypothetical protein